MYEYEKKLINQGFKLIVGVDEIGRDCLAWPIVVASFILPVNYINDEIKILNLY